MRGGAFSRFAPHMRGVAFSRFAASDPTVMSYYQRVLGLNKSFDQTFSKVWLPAGLPEAMFDEKSGTIEIL